MRIHIHFVVAWLSYCISFHTLKLVYTHKFLLDFMHVSMHLEFPPACSPVPYNLTVIVIACSYMIFWFPCCMMLFSNYVSQWHKQILQACLFFVPKSFIKLLPEPRCAELHLSPFPSPYWYFPFQHYPQLFSVFLISFISFHFLSIVF